MTIPLLDAVALTGLVQKIPAGPQLILSNRITKTPNPLPTAEWDILRANHGTVGFTRPGSEAEIIEQSGRSHLTAALAYIRVKKVFDPMTLYFVRQPGGLGLQNAAQAVAREVSNLNERIDNTVELTLWGALGGSASLPQKDGTTDVVTYGFDTSHQITLTSTDKWDDAAKTYQQLINDIRTWKHLIEVDARVPATAAFATELTLDKIFDIAAKPVATNDVGSVTSFVSNNFLSDRMKDAYYATGQLPGFMGMNWQVVSVSNLYDNSSGVPTQVVADGKIYINNLDAGNPWELREGATADLSNTQGAVGKYSKSWKQEDPSDEQFLIEYSFLPIITRPEQFAVITAY